MKTVLAYFAFSCAVIIWIGVVTSLDVPRSPAHCLQQPWLDMSRGC